MAVARQDEAPKSVSQTEGLKQPFKSKQACKAAKVNSQNVLKGDSLFGFLELCRFKQGVSNKG